MSEWTDQSGIGNDLTQATLAVAARSWCPGALNGLPVLRFDGTDDALTFTTRLDGTIRAVFAVLKDAGDGTRQDVPRRHGRRDDFSLGCRRLWRGGYASAVMMNGETWLNGVAVNGTATTRPTTMSVLSVLTTAGVTADRLFAAATHDGYSG